MTPADTRKPRVLLVCDEWTPAHGGISMVNRELSSALAILGFQVMCLVLSATADELADAASRDIRLVTAKQTPSGPTMYLLPEAIQAFHPDVVIGHDHITGSFAWIYAKEHFPEADLIHITHTIPPESEPHKRGPGAHSRIERREEMTRRIAEDAAVVAAVGPRVARYIRDVVGGSRSGVHVHELVPGIHLSQDVGVLRDVPANPTVLLLGRADEAELKGLDIAATALAGVKVRTGRPAPVLFVRGPTSNGCDWLRRHLADTAGLALERVDVRSFTSEVDQVQGSLLRAALCVMPSRVEPFGLVALEAISLGTPVLLTDKSGAAETLSRTLGRMAEPMIVKSDDDPVRHLATWTYAMQHVLDDLDAAFAFADKVRSHLAESLSWDKTGATLMAQLDRSSR